MSETMHDPITLMQAAQGGDSDAFAQLYELYFTPVFRYLRLRLSDHDTAEDLAQTTFLKVYQSLPNYQGTAKPIAYFFRVARNTLIDFYRKKKDVLISEDKQEMFDRIEDHNPTPDHQLHKEQQRQLVLQAMEKLEGDQKDVVFLKFIKELSYSEIATIMDKKEPAVRKITSRALMRLRSQFDTSPLLSS